MNKNLHCSEISCSLTSVIETFKKTDTGSRSKSILEENPFGYNIVNYSPEIISNLTVLDIIKLRIIHHHSVTDGKRVYPTCNQFSIHI